MSSQTINANEHLIVSIRIEGDGADEVHVFVDAELPVYAYVVDQEGLDAYENGDEFESYGGSHERRIHDRVISVDGPGDYYLLIINNQDEATACYYQVD